MFFQQADRRNDVYLESQCIEYTACVHVMTEDLFLRSV